MDLPARACVTAITIAAFVVITGHDLAATEAPRPWPPDQFVPVTRERIAALPADQQPVWRAYWEASDAWARVGPAPAVPDFSPLQPLASAPIGARLTRGLRLKAVPAWYAGAEARTIADRVVAWQSVAGGWTKGIDYTQPRPAAGPAEVDLWSRGTFDNDATIFELRFLALVTAAAADGDQSAAWREAFPTGFNNTKGSCINDSGNTT